MYLQMLWLTELFSHFKQLNGFSSVWILMCVFKLCEHLNFFSHFKHLNGFSSAWILPCVFKCWMTELLFTLWAAEWFFINMNSSMCLQIVWTPELLFTLWAAEWFFISMNTFMCLQMLWLTELLFTLLAAEWFLASVDSFMYLYLADWNECLATFWATDLSVANFTFYDWQVVRCTLNFHKIFFVVHGGSTIEFVPELKKKIFYMCYENIQLYMRACSWKSAECEEQRCYQMCDKSSLYMYFKKLGFSGFSHPVEPEIRIFFHQNMTSCIRLNLRP